MRLAKVNAYVEAYYSGNHYEETVFADYDSVAHLDGKELYVHELDGKHSMCSGTVNVTLIADDYPANNSAPENDGEHLFYFITERHQVDQDAIVRPVFGKTKREIECTDTQWGLIQLILEGN